MGKKTIGVYWFTNDLRLDDNPLLAQAAQEVDQLICLYCLPSYSEYLKRFTSESHYGSARERFWQQSVASLDQALNEKGQRLVVSQAHPFSALAHLMSNDNVSALYCDDFVAHDERLIVQHLSSYFPLVKICQRSQRTLFQQFELPFTLDALPASFTQFRKMVEGQPIALPHCAINKLPAPAKHSLETVTLPEVSVSSRDDFVGGEHFAHAHMMCYFSTSFASRYKQTRNELDGKENSTKFSPWLAVGSLSPIQIMHALNQYEHRNGSNESTYWIFFELLWREYFQWYARKFGVSLFQRKGVQNKPPLTTFYPQRFKQWKMGNTEYPLVNACMKQLNQTGYMSNRGRQLVASCLIYELGIDWRYGAAYMESQLVDYDVGSNWGNWQYIAGVGASRSARRFDQSKQAALYDPQGEFVLRWNGNSSVATSDNVDMVDWPKRA